MYDLQPDSTINDVFRFVGLCQEYDINRVFVAPAVFQRIQELKKYKSSYLAFQNVKFIKK